MNSSKVHVEHLHEPVAHDSAVVCPCSSGATYGLCCAPYHLGDKAWKTLPNALSMLRARYSAHCLMLSDFVIRTVHPSFRYGKNEKKFAQHVAQVMHNVQWLALEVHSTGLVCPTKDIQSAKRAQEFATYSLKYKTLDKVVGTVNQEHHTHHTSYFERLDGVLYYTEDLENMASRSSIRQDAPYSKTKRNDICPCGSGKKYKKCCLSKQDGEV